MNNQKSTSRSKKSSGLKSKHLLVALFAVAVGAVCGAVVGLMQTSVHSDANTRAAASAAKEGTVEVWAPRGASAPMAVIEPVQQAPVETEEQQKTEGVAQASESEQAEIAAASSPATTEKPQKTVSRVQRKKTVQKKVNEAQTQAAAPSETPAVQLPQAKAPETAVTAVKSADEVPAAPQPKPQPATEEPAVAKEPPREPPKAVVTDNLF